MSECRKSLGEIAKYLGLSKCAVSLALNGSDRISAGTRTKVLAFAKKIGYRKDAAFSRMMSNIKTSKKNVANETIAFVSASIVPDAAKRYPIFSEYTRGARAEAERLGFAIYEIWMHERGLTAEKLRKVLLSRGIRGGIILAHIDDDSIPSGFSSLLKDFTFVSAGLRTSNPILDFVSADKFLIAKHETERVIKSGFHRPALILDEKIDALVDGRFSGGFLRAQLAIPEKDRIPPFLNVSRARKNPKILFNWIKKNNPDAVFSVSTRTSEWLESLGNFPDSVKLINIEKPDKESGWQGIDENYFAVGTLAVRKLFDLLNRPSYLRDLNIPTATIIEPRWRDEKRKQNNKRKSI